MRQPAVKHMTRENSKHIAVIVRVQRLHFPGIDIQAVHIVRVGFTISMRRVGAAAFEEFGRRASEHHGKTSIRAKICLAVMS